MFEKDNISFVELQDKLSNGEINDVNNPVWMALTASRDDLQGITEWFREIGLIDPNDCVDDIILITGNCLGTQGRTDMLLSITGRGIINPIVRMQVDGLKWTSDFIHNYRKDYNM